MIAHGRRGSLDSATVEEARRAMISAGYVLPPQCQPVPVEQPSQPPPMPMPMAARRRHSISCSPVAGTPVPSCGSPTSLTGRKRRFSLPGGLGIPLTDYLPSEFKRRRTSPEPAPEPTATTLPSISNLINLPTTLLTASTVLEHPEPCLPPHTAATPDHPYFMPSVSAPMPLKEQQMLAPISVALPQQPPVDALPRAAWAGSHAALVHAPGSSSSSSPSSSAPSSPGQPDVSAEQQKSLEDEAVKERKAQRVAEIIDLMDRQNCASAAGTDSGADSGVGSWPGDLKRRRVGKDQTGTLDLVFKVEQMPSQAVKKRLADGLGMTYKQVQIWFQNKRARCKRAVEAPPRSSHTFHNMLVSSDGRFMMKDLAKPQQHHQPQPQPLVRYHRHHELPSPSPPAPLPLRSCILSR